MTHTLEELEAILTATKAENDALKARIKSLRTPTGTNLLQDDYMKLAGGGTDFEITDAEATLLINRQFGFEASVIRILHEAEIDVSDENSIYSKIDYIPRESIYVSSDCNYIRFNVDSAGAARYYEMIDDELYTVSI